ncbi:hypothetical protein QZH56_11845 [Streptomyces olivoreticuli]|uniref:hypothetical protein n=1 Tax=Streptomyces olivoreticuli TaxID=68246 RepID=UPI002658CB65|nr:hypothetical protein [Streptomyces olivoreticuli]WKK21019.1 hypothetical protein QZH56_19240 [Streptomyces olivoreticuli]WKK26216.1 hypothetical protein QZH56_11845 [Streptomyces olivoreticuli]
MNGHLPNLSELKSASVGDWAETIAFAVMYYVHPPVLWCPASRCWIEGEAPYAPLDPALWRVRMAAMLSEVAYYAGDISPEGTLVPERPGWSLTWTGMARAVRHASGPITRDMKEILSGEPVFRRESVMTPERWLSLREQSAGDFVSRRDLIAAFRRDCPNAAIGERAFLILARELLGRDGRFGPKGARGPWGFRVRLPR